MRPPKLWFLLIVIFAGFISAAFIFGLQADDHSPRAMPGTFPLKDESDAEAVGRTVAMGELAMGAEAQEVKLIGVQKTGSAELVTTLNAEGTYPDESFAKGFNGVWIVTFHGRFSPRKYGRDNPPIFSTMTVLLDAKNGSVVGVEMHDKQK